METEQRQARESKESPLVPAQDGLPARLVGVWSTEKLYYIRRYLDIVSTGMKRKFASRVYIDLFAGPGRCVLRGRHQEADGSPLLALKAATPFTQYHLVEKDPQAAAALRARATREVPSLSPFYYPEDANSAITKIIGRIPSRSLCVAMIDPTGLHLKFSSLQLLTDSRRVDLIYLFPEGMAVKRNLVQFLRQSHGPLDEVLGTDQWRLRVTVPEGRDPVQRWEAAGRPIVEIFQQQLRSIGYVEVSGGASQIEIRNTQNVPLYYLVFASKHARGHEFWGKAQAEHESGQRHLF